MEEIKIVLENNELVIVNKPAGIVTTNENNKSGISVENWLKNDLPRGGLVHRLDKGTSGLLVAAKNEDTLIRLKKVWKDRGVIKKYLALVSGDFPFEATVEMPIGRDSFKFDRFAVRENGKTAKTIFKKIKKYLLNGKEYSLIEADLKTGRTHQIRVHLKHLRWPIVGDRLYGGEMFLDRPFLHSYYLKFEDVEVEIGMSADLLEILAKSV